MKTLAIATLAGLALASSASAQLTPPNFVLDGGQSTAAHQQSLGGGFSVTGFRLQVDAGPALGFAWQSDIEMTLMSPNGTTLLIGPNFGTPPGNYRWDDAALNPVGSPPANIEDPQLIDVTYDFAMGPVDGLWSVSFRHTYGSGGDITWNNIQVTPIPAPGSMALLAIGGVLAARRRR